MNSFSFRAVIASLVLTALVVPLNAHHGTQFLNKAMEGNTAEVRFAEMALSKSQNPRVKEFAEMLVRDHKQALEKIHQLRTARMADASTQPKDRPAKDASEVQLTSKHQQALDKLSGLSGAAFDREYINLMVSEHRNNIRAFENQTRAHGNSGNKQVRNQPGADTTREKPTTEDRKYSNAELRQDLDTIEFANSVLPTMRHHLQRAQELQRELTRT